MPKTKRALFSLHLLLSLAACLPQARLHAADADNDGLDDDWESANGLNPAKTTVLIYIDAANGADATTGQSAAAAKASLGGALSALQANAENAVMAAPGTYSGPSNRGLSVSYADLKILPSGSGAVVFDLGGAGRLLSATGSVFGMRGVTVRNGYVASGGTAVDLSATSAVLDGCVFEGNISGRKVTGTYGNGETYEYWTDANGTAAVKAAGGALYLLAYHGGVVEFLHGVGIEHGVERDAPHLAPRDGEAWLTVVEAAVHGHGDDGYVGHAGTHHGVLDEGIVVAGTALATRLRDGDGGVLQVIAT